MEESWKKIFISTNRVKVEIIKQMLEENNIVCISLNQQDSSYNMFGTINLYVPEESTNKAIRLIEQHNNE